MSDLDLKEALALGRRLLQEEFYRTHSYYVDYPHINLHSFEIAPDEDVHPPNQPGTYCGFCGGHRRDHNLTREEGQAEGQRQQYG